MMRLAAKRRIRQWMIAADLMRQDYRGLGWQGAVARLVKPAIFKMLSRLGADVRRSLYSVRVRGLRHPLYCRPRSSDSQVLRQIFVERSYDAVALEAPHFIIDCGANVGYSAALFLSRYPYARVVAIEPDPANFDMLRRNLAPYGSRARVIHAAIWPHDAPLKVVRGEFRDGREWSTQVREARADEQAEVQGVSIDSILRDEARERVDLLKMDIERSEIAVFGAESATWIPRVSHIVIELHDADCATAFNRAISRRPHQIQTIGETTYCDFADLRR